MNAKPRLTPPNNYRNSRKSSLRFRGFTLAELLIALMILAVIAVFTIPKILVTQQSQKYNAIVKEDIAALSGAYMAYKSDNPNPPANFNGKNLTPYLNYVLIDSTSTINVDYYQTWVPVSFPCNNVEPCIKMHNGSVIKFRWTNFGGTNNTNAISFFIDPDGQVTDGTTNGPGKSVALNLYYNGRVTTGANTLPGSADSYGALGAVPDPPWLSWN